MDLSNFSSTYRPEEGSELHLRDPAGSPLSNDDGTPMSLTLLGSDSDVAVKARNASTNRVLKQRGRGQITAESAQADATALLAACTTGWNITLGGQKPEFSREAVARLYADPKFAFIREQADEFIAERANFMKGSPKT
jgi:hypothetical protein